MIPLVFIHQHWHWHIEYALFQARHSNPDAPLYFIGTQPPLLPPNALFFPIGDFWDTAQEFGAVYRHLNQTDPGFEVFCLQRWLVLLDFLRAQGISRCYYLDSDVLLFQSINADAPLFDDCLATYLQERGPLNGYINSVEFLASFRDFLFELYGRDFQPLEDWYRTYRATGAPGGVSDMMVFDLFRAARGGKFGDLCRIRAGATHDHNINASDGFRLGRRGKKLHWKRGLPFGELKESGETIRFKSLHFQGFAKELMPACTHLTPRMRLILRLRGPLWRSERVLARVRAKLASRRP